MVNENVLNSVCAGRYIGFLPIEKIDKKKQTRLLARRKDMMDLSEMFSRQRVDRQCFLEIAEQAADAWLRCEQSRLNPVNLDLTASHMFYLPHLRKVWFIYWPIVNNQSPSDIAEFLRRLPMLFSAQPGDGAVNLDDYFALFQKNTLFSTEKIRRALADMLGKTVHEKTVLPLTSEGAVKDLYFSPPPRKDVEYDPLSMLQTPLVSSSFPPADHLAVSTLSVSGDQLPIAHSSASSVAPSHSEVVSELPVPSDSACLYRQDTGEYIFLTEDVFSIGRDAESNHYAVIGAGAVSRNHAEIIRSQGRFYLRDKGSKNKTRINGVEVAAGAYAEILADARILVADTEFIFINQTHYPGTKQ